MTNSDCVSPMECCAGNWDSYDPTYGMTYYGYQLGCVYDGDLAGSTCVGLDTIVGWVKTVIIISVIVVVLSIVACILCCCGCIKMGNRGGRAMVI